MHNWGKKAESCNVIWKSGVYFFKLSTRRKTKNEWFRYRKNLLLLKNNFIAMDRYIILF